MKLEVDMTNIDQNNDSRTTPTEIDAISGEHVPNSVAILAGKNSPIPQEEIERIAADIIAAIKTVYDPEIPADIYELGLIYKIDIEDDRSVNIDMTVTAPGCPVAGEMPGWVQTAVSPVEGILGVDVRMVFDPPWTPDRMSEEAQVAIGWF
jgi:FeS assembly SUF system protein